jgi:hypothetical protein
VAASLRDALAHLAEILIIGAAGGAVLALAHFPAGWLSGAIIHRGALLRRPMLVPNGGVTGGDGANISGRPHELPDGNAGAFHVRKLGAKQDEIDRADDHRFVSGLGRVEMNGPAGPRTNEVFVADGCRNRRVIVFDAGTGAYKRHWGAYGNKPDGSNWLKSRQMSPPRRQTKKSNNRCTANRYVRFWRVQLS